MAQLENFTMVSSRCVAFLLALNVSRAARPAITAKMTWITWAARVQEMSKRLGTRAAVHSEQALDLVCPIAAFVVLVLSI